MHFKFFPRHNNPYLYDPDVILMLEFQKGDKHSFETLMRRHYKSIFNLGLRFTGNRHYAEDLAQDVFIKVYKSAGSYYPKAKFKTWLYRIAKNTILNFLRKHHLKDFSLDEPQKGFEGGLKRQFEDKNAVLASDDLKKKELINIVKDAIASLPENQRMAVILRRYENMSYEDIAVAMKCSIKAVKSLLNRAKEGLKDRLSVYENDL